MVNFDVAYRKSSASYRTQPHLLEGALQKSSSSWLSGELCVTEIALNMIRKEKTLSKDAFTNIIKKIARRINAITCVGDYSAILTRHCTRGRSQMTSAKFLGFWTPSPLVSTKSMQSPVRIWEKTPPPSLLTSFVHGPNAAAAVASVCLVIAAATAAAGSDRNA